MRFAHVMPSPAAPLLNQLFGTSGSLRSAYSVCQTLCVVLSVPETGEEYACEVTTPSRFNAPAVLIALVMVTWLLQPSESQQVIFVERPAAASVGEKTLMKSSHTRHLGHRNDCENEPAACC